jgi:hypothetical protein
VEQRLFEEILELFEAETTPECTGAVVLALNGLADNLVAEAKKQLLKGDEGKAMEQLNGAQSFLSRASERMPDQPYVLGTEAYLTFLRGNVDRAQELLKRAVQLGGEDLRRAELASVQRDQLAGDELFIQWIENAASGLAAST